MERESLLRRAEVLAAPVRLALPQPGAWLVGGTVRDLLMEREPADVDVAAVDAEVLANRFADAGEGRAARIGRELGTWRVAAGDRYYDFAPLQGDSIEEDLARRDYTVNAMAVSVDAPGELLDPFHGESDLRGRVIRAVRERNLDDDPLRTLRGLRFAVTLDATIDAETWEWIRARRAAVGEIAGERVQYELERMFAAAPARAIELLRTSGLGDLILGFPLDEDIQRAAERLSPSADAVIQLLAVLGLQGGIDDIAARLQQRRWPSATAARAAAIVGAAALEWRDPADHVILLQRLQRRDAANLVDVLHALKRTDEADRLDRYLSLLDPTWWRQRPLLSGGELASRFGLSGPAIGRALAELLSMQLRGEVSTLEQARDVMEEISRSV